MRNRLRDRRLSCHRGTGRMGRGAVAGGARARLVRRPVTEETPWRPLEVLATALGGAHTMTEVGAAIAAYAMARLPVDAAALVLRTGGSGPPRTLAVAGPLAEELDALREELGHPRDIRDLPSGATLTIDDTRTDTTWPAWSAGAARHGVRWVHLVELLPLGSDEVRLELSSHRPRACTADDLVRADELASGAGLALRLAHRVVHLEDAMQTRDLIGQGQGIVMERFGLDAGQAMAFLRRQSQQSQVKLRDLARDLARGIDGAGASPTERSRERR